MSIQDDFNSFLDKIKVINATTIALRYEELTCASNQDFRDTGSKFANRLRVGSYGRWTAIKGIYDLDMLYIVPAGCWSTSDNNGKSALLGCKPNQGIAPFGSLCFQAVVCGLQVTMADLFWLSDEQWVMIEPFMPRDQPGPERKDDRQIISGILHVPTTSCRWRD